MTTASLSLKNINLRPAAASPARSTTTRRGIGPFFRLLRGSLVGSFGSFGRVKWHRLIFRPKKPATKLTPVVSTR